MTLLDCAPDALLLSLQVAGVVLVLFLVAGIALGYALSQPIPCAGCWTRWCRCRWCFRRSPSASSC